MMFLLRQTPLKTGLYQDPVCTGTSLSVDSVKCDLGHLRLSCPNERNAPVNILVSLGLQENVTMC